MKKQNILANLEFVRELSMKFVLQKCQSLKNIVLLRELRPVRPPVLEISKIHMRKNIEIYIGFDRNPSIIQMLYTQKTSLGLVVLYVDQRPIYTIIHQLTYVAY